MLAEVLLDRSDPIRLSLTAGAVALLGGAVAILQGSDPLTLRSVIAGLLGSTMIGVGSVLLWLGLGPSLMPDKISTNSYVPLLIALPCGYGSKFVLEFILQLVKRIFSTGILDKLLGKYLPTGLSATNGTDPPAANPKPPSDEIIKPRKREEGGP